MTTVVNVHAGDHYDIYIGRGSDWGNPYHEGRHGTRMQVIEKYRQWILTRPDLLQRVKRELRDKTLGCFCKPKKCHGDVLAAIANDDIAYAMKPR